VKDLLARRFPERVSLAQMATELESSPFTLCRIFKRQTGITVNTYLLRLRLREALLRIAGGQTELLQIALDVGLSDHSHFTLRFAGPSGRRPPRSAMP
jgi:two-component system response regulator YesN